MRRILLIAHNWDYLPLAPYNMALHLGERGYDVSLLLPSEKLSRGFSTKRVNDRLTLYFCPTVLWGRFKKGLDPLDLLTKLYLVRKLEYDIIFVFDSRPTVILPGVYGRLSKKVPLIVYWTDWFGRDGIIAERSGALYRFLFEGVETFFEEYFSKYADSYAVISPALETRLRAMGYDKEVVFLPLGCNSPPIRDYDVKGLRSRLGLPQNTKLIGCVGSLYPSDALLAFQSIAAVRETMDATLILIGNNIYKNRYTIPEHAIQTAKLSSRDMYDHIGACDLMLMPLRTSIANNGRWPSKLNEYLIMGKPVVSTDICIVKELLKIATFGEIAEDEPADFARKIITLLNDGKALKDYGENAHALAADVLSWKTVVDSVDGLVDETLRTAS